MMGSELAHPRKKKWIENYDRGLGFCCLSCWFMEGVYQDSIPLTFWVLIQCAPVTTDLCLAGDLGAPSQIPGPSVES